VLLLVRIGLPNKCFNYIKEILQNQTWISMSTCQPVNQSTIHLHEFQCPLSTSPQYTYMNFNIHCQPVHNTLTWISISTVNQSTCQPVSTVNQSTIHLHEFQYPLSTSPQYTYMNFNVHRSTSPQYMFGSLLM